MAGNHRSGGNRTLGSDRSEIDSGPSKPELEPDVSAKWDELLPQLQQDSLRAVDVHELKTLCHLLVLADKLASAVLADPDDCQKGRLWLNTNKQIHQLSASFGLNPGDRKRLDFAPAPEPDPFTEYFARMTKPA